MFFKNALPLASITCCVGLFLSNIQVHSDSPICGTHLLEKSEISRESPSQLLHKNLEEFFEEMQQYCPEFATYVGNTKALNGLWTDHSEEGYSQRYQLVLKRLESLSLVDREQLSFVDKLNYDLLKKDLKDSSEDFQFQIYYMPLDQLGGIPLDVPSTLMMMPKENFEDYEAILMRLSGIPVLIDQTIDLLKKGIEKGLVQPQIALRTLPGNISKMIPLSYDKSVFFQPFTTFPVEISIDQQKVLANRALKLISREVYPAYTKLLAYLEKEYIPSCRETIGIGDLPNGKALYEFNVRRHTTTHLTPQEIHEIGLKEVARIQLEMQKILDETHFSGNIADYFEYLNTSLEFFYTEPESLIEGYKTITSYIDGQLPLLFSRLPKLPYEVLPVPSFLEEGQVGAYYMRGSLATGRPGRFYANTYDIGSRPKWQMESLSLHEAVPGHHFQISLAQEIEDLPEFRKYNNYTAYIEGWGLYSESLGQELGLYKTPSAQFGRLIEEIWRAVRLVVDTGMHSLGWTRDESIGYMMEKTGMSEREVVTEIDRYIVWPGQALAYKIGELSIQQWRREAQEVLKNAFDIKAFHDMLLEQGALPLDICEEYVHNWIEKQI